MSSFEIIPLICLIVSDLSHTLLSRSKTLAPRPRSQVPQGTHGRSGADGRVVHVRLGPKLKSSRRANVFCSSPNSRHSFTQLCVNGIRPSRHSASHKPRHHELIA